MVALLEAVAAKEEEADMVALLEAVDLAALPEVALEEAMAASEAVTLAAEVAAVDMAALPAAEVPVLVEAVLEDMEVHKVEALWDPLEETAASVI